MTEKIDMISKTDYAFENVEALGFEPRSKGLFHVSLVVITQEGFALLARIHTRINNVYNRQAQYQRVIYKLSN